MLPMGLPPAQRVFGPPLIPGLRAGVLPEATRGFVFGPRSYLGDNSFESGRRTRTF
jgi:hypothetical protein